MADMNHSERVEGYWRRTESEESPLPWPVLTPGWGEAGFLAFLRLVEKEAETVFYRGFSPSRLTGERNGSREFVFNGWRWPEGLGHYIERGARPSDDFIMFIMLEAEKITGEQLMENDSVSHHRY